MKGKLLKRWRGLLALVLSMSIFVGGNITVFAAQPIEKHPGELSVGDIVTEEYCIKLITTGGLRICYIEADGSQTHAVGTTDKGSLDGYRYYESYNIREPLKSYGATGWKVLSNNHTSIGDEFTGGRVYAIVLTPEPAISQETQNTPNTPDIVCPHDFQWIVTQEPTAGADGSMREQCVNCKTIRGEAKSITGSSNYVQMVDAAIENAAQGAAVELNTYTWCTLNKKIVDALASRPDVSITFTYMYKGQSCTLNIPAGAELASLLDENGYVGFQKVAQSLASK